MRATVDLPEPDSPTSAKVSPLRDLEGDVVDGLEELLLAALQHAVEPRLRDVEDAAEIAHLDERTVARSQRRQRGGAHAATPSSSGGWVTHLCASAVGSSAS